MAGPLLLGLDLGSGRCKAAVVDSGGQIVVVARDAMPLRRSGGAASYRPDELLRIVRGVAREALSGVDRAAVEGIGVASMAESGVLLDARLAPIGEIVAWFDPRGAAEAAEIESRRGADALFAITGLRAAGKQTLPRLVRLRREEPAVLGRAARWAGVAEWVVLALSGGLTTVPSLACRTLAYDLNAGSWDPELLALAGWLPEQMPPVVEAGTPAGALTRAAAAQLGLRAGVPVAVAGHDHVVGSYAAGVLEPGLAADSMGSAEVILTVTGAPAKPPAARAAGLSAGRHVLPGRHYLLGALSASGALLEWVVDRFAPPSAGETVEHRLHELLSGVRPPSGLVAAPFLAVRPPVSGPPLGGARESPARALVPGLALAGLRERHGPADIVLAALEGASMAMCDLCAAIETVAGATVREVRLFGGGTRLPHWPELKAALEDRPVRRLAEADATAVGAAWIGGAAAGVTDLGAPRAGCIEVEPPPGLRDAYAGRWRDRYRRLAGGPQVARGGA